MRTKAIKVFSFLLVATIFITMLIGCNKKEIELFQYPGSRTSYAYDTDNTVPFLTDGKALYTNQNRGLRGEVYITLGSETAFPDSNESAYELLYKEMAEYPGDNVKMLQVYVYLIDFHDKKLTESALQQFVDYLKTINMNGFRVLLRFAYEYTESKNIGPKTNMIITHLKQIKKVIDNNLALFYDTVYAVQFGLIGLWGEGHGNINNHNVEKLLKAIGNTIPENLQIMVRTPSFLSKVPNRIESRFSLHDDFLVGEDHEWGMISFDHPEYQKMLNKCKFALTDGEMPWGSYQAEGIDPIGFIRQCVGYGLTSLSAKHNYKEGDKYHLEQWKDVYITKEQLDTNKFPYNNNLLSGGKISVFDYLQYHLGYQIAVSNFKNEDSNLSFILTNFGMAAPFNYELQYIINGKIVAAEDFQATDLRIFGQKVITLSSENIESFGIRLYNKYDNSSIKLANNLPFVNGVNQLIF